MSLGTPGLQKWASRYWECPGWEQFAFEDLEGHTDKYAVHLKSFKIKTIRLTLESQNISEHNPTPSLSLSYYQGMFFFLFNFKPFGQGVLWIWQKETENKSDPKSRSKAFILLTKPQIKMKEKRCVQISSKHLLSVFWMTLFSNNLQKFKS